MGCTVKSTSQVDRVCKCFENLVIKYADLKIIKFGSPWPGVMKAEVWWRERPRRRGGGGKEGIVARPPLIILHFRDNKCRPI